MNLYGFASGDPVNFSDPFGLCPECEVLEEAAEVARRAGPIVTVAAGAATVVGAAPLALIGIAGAVLVANRLLPDDAGGSAAFPSFIAASDMTAVGMAGRRGKNRDVPDNRRPHEKSASPSTREKHEDTRNPSTDKKRQHDRWQQNPNKRQGP